MLPLLKTDFEKLLISFESQSVSLIPSKKMLKEGDSFYFKIKSAEDGYYSILNVYENGEVFILCDNVPIQAGKEDVFPDPESDIDLVAGLFPGDRTTLDMYVAIVNRNSIGLSRIQKAGAFIEKEEMHFKFQEVIELMDQNNFSTVLLRVKSRF